MRLRRIIHPFLAFPVVAIILIAASPGPIDFRAGFKAFVPAAPIVGISWSEASMASSIRTSAPPPKATLLSPSGTINTSTPTYKWNAVPSATYYQLWVNDSQAQPKVATWYTSGQVDCAGGTGTCSVTPSTPLVAGAAWWWIQTWNESGYGPWSNALGFTVSILPGKASLISPFGTTAISSPTFSWQAASNATWYYLWVNDVADSSGKFRKWYRAEETGCSSGMGTCAVSPGVTLAPGACQWWIQTWNESGYGPWSDGMAFTVSARQDFVDVEVGEKANINRDREYVSFGIPIAREWDVKDPNRFRLRDGSGNPVPAQFESLARWGSTPSNTSAPVKWLLAGYFESLQAKGTKTIRLDAGGPGPSPSQSVKITTSTGKLHIDTGAARFEINVGDNYNILNQVTIDNKTLLEPLDRTGAIQYKPVGNLGIVAGGNPDLTPRVISSVVERDGPLNSDIKLRGSIMAASDQALLDFTVRYHFFAGKSDVRLDFTVENNHPVIAGEFDQPENAHNQGSINSVYIGNLKLSLKLKNAASPLRVLTEQESEIVAPSAPVRLYQDSSGTSFWNNYTGLVGWPGFEASAEPRLQSYCTLPGFEITGGSSVIREKQASGWMTVFRDGSAEPRIGVCLRDFWQNFPKSIQTDTDGTLSVDLFPNGQQFKHNLRIGEQKTHSLLYHFGLGEISRQVANAQAAAFNDPLFGVARNQWYTRSGALGEVPEMNLNLWPLYERFVRTAFEPNPDFNPSIDDPNLGNSTLRDAIRKYNFYGWQDFGDIPLDYESFGPLQAGQMNLKYWYLHGMLIQFCRSGDLAWMSLAKPAARHLSDIDYLHIPDEGIQHWSHGAYFGHSQHDEPGNRNPNRNYNSPSVDLFFGVPDLLLAYYLTGENRFREVALEGLEAMLNLSQFSDFEAPTFSREHGNLVFGYISGYAQTGDRRWLDQLKKVVGYLSNLQNKAWVANPSAFGAANPESYLRMFQFDQVVWTLGKYLDFIREFGLSDDQGTVNALTSYADFAVNHVMVEYRSGRAAHRYDYVFSDPTATDLDINNWALVMADALAYAYKYSGQRKYLDAAAKFYATGTIDPVWQGDPPVYISAKDLVNSCNWGLVYMNQSLKAGTALTAGSRFHRVVR